MIPFRVTEPFQDHGAYPFRGYEPLAVCPENFRSGGVGQQPGPAKIYIGLGCHVEIDRTHKGHFKVALPQFLAGLVKGRQTGGAHGVHRYAWPL